MISCRPMVFLPPAIPAVDLVHNPGNDDDDDDNDDDDDDDDDTRNAFVFLFRRDIDTTKDVVITRNVLLKFLIIATVMKFIVAA